jgi:hypothetical protein
MHWATYRHIPGDAPEKPTRPQARQANSSLDAASSTLQDYPAQGLRLTKTLNNRLQTRAHSS